MLSQRLVWPALQGCSCGASIERKSLPGSRICHGLAWRTLKRWSFWIWLRCVVAPLVPTAVASCFLESKQGLGVCVTSESSTQTGLPPQARTHQLQLACTRTLQMRQLLTQRKPNVFGPRHSKSTVPKGDGSADNGQQLLSSTTSALLLT